MKSFIAASPPTVPAIEPVSHHIPIILLLVILATTIFILIFRRHSNHQRRMQIINAQKKRKFDTAAMDTSFEKQPDLLGSTVSMFEIRQHRQESTIFCISRIKYSEKQRPMQTFDASQRHASWAPSPAPPRTQYRALSGGSLDFRAGSARNTPDLGRTRPDRYQTTKLKENQYWV
ncbi:unnamed protein product [Gongylonema pulchrum]|uniref:Transmembrane protein n=1 Tax=Gongylonema pulchrum TaxID=637853 RepID=A0A183EYL5_9BILA|nr:unnamed protein product [Gongylonema pulchrum]